MTEQFFTWGDLATYGGAVMAVLIITEFTKDLPLIRRLPTRLWAYCIALTLLLAAVVFTSDVIYADLETMIGEEAMKKFDRKGWDLD